METLGGSQNTTTHTGSYGYPVGGRSKNIISSHWVCTSDSGKFDVIEIYNVTDEGFLGVIQHGGNPAGPRTLGSSITLPQAIEAVLEVQILMKGILDLRRQDS
jgi:hypothetical protein